MVPHLQRIRHRNCKSGTPTRVDAKTQVPGVTPSVNPLPVHPRCILSHDSLRCDENSRRLFLNTAVVFHSGPSSRVWDSSDPLEKSDPWRSRWSRWSRRVTTVRTLSTSHPGPRRLGVKGETRSDLSVVESLLFSSTWPLPTSDGRHERQMDPTSLAATSSRSVQEVHDAFGLTRGETGPSTQCPLTLGTSVWTPACPYVHARHAT